jgi:hypothetical protein
MTVEMEIVNNQELNVRIAAIVKKVERTQRAATFRPALVKTGAHMQREMGQEPVKAAGAFTRLATPKQRRAYWARVSKKKARHGPHGYIREGSTKQWTFDPKKTRVTIGTITKHARYVWGRQQQPFHKETGWPKANEVLQDEADTIVGFFEDAARRALERG